MPNVIFQHEHVEGGTPLVVNTGMDEIAWSYNLNVAKWATYGGEVVQILSTYIDDIMVSGTLRNYEEGEAIYEYFMKYFLIATQGPSAANASEAFEQQPMVMKYPERRWEFLIQPLRAPGFMYGAEIVAPKWQLKAHIVDKAKDVSALKELTETETINKLLKGEFKLRGVISPASGNPALNPFIAPVTPSSKNTKTGQIEFEPRKAKAISEGLSKIGDYYHSLLPKYIQHDFSNLTADVGSRPIFGRPSSETEQAETPEEVFKALVKGQKK